MKPYLIAIMLYLTCVEAAAQDNIHVVKKGETFANIARRYGISEEELKDANRGKTVCYVGQKLSIPANATASQQSESNSVPSTSQNVYSYASQATPQETENKPKKKKKSFWKSLGEIANAAGNVVVGVADGLSAAGLLDDTGDVGAIIGGTADVVNLTRGTQSNYLAEATNGEYSSAGEYEDYEYGDNNITPTKVNYDTRSIEEIDRQIAALRAEDEKLEKQNPWSNMKNYNYSTGKSRSEIRAERKEELNKNRKENAKHMKNLPRGTKMSSHQALIITQKTQKSRKAQEPREYSNSNYVGIKKNSEKAMAIAKRQTEIRKQIKQLLARKAELLNNPDVVNEKSAFEKERSKRNKVYSNPKVKAARQKAANVHNYQKSQDIANDRAWRLRNDPTYMPEYQGEEREKKAQEFEEQGEYYHKKINE